MANIYSQQGITETPVAKIGEMSTASEARQSAKMFDAIQDNFEKKAKEHQALAEKLYENGSNIAITQGLNELSRNPKYASNPEAFALEADKMAEKIYAQIDDPNMKTEVAMNYELKKNPYINRAYDNMYKQQNKQYENQVVAGIQENMYAFGMSVSNVMSGTMGVDDLRTLAESKNQFEKYLNAKNAQGEEIFSEKERISMRDRYSKNVVKSIIGAYDDLPQKKREEVAKMFDGDSVPSELKQALSSPELRELKNHIIQNKDLEYKRLRHQQAVADFMKKQEIARNEFALSTQIDGIEDPVEQINILNDNKDNVSEKYYKAKSKAIYSTLAITPKTNAETFSTLMKRIRNLDANDPSDFVKSSSEILSSIEETVAKGELLRSDKAILMKAMDKTEKPSVEKIGEGKSSFFTWGFDYDDAAKYIKENSENSSDDYDMMLDYYRTIEGKNYNSDDRRKALSGVVESRNRKSFQNGIVKEGSPFSTANTYFVENLPQNMVQKARETLLANTQSIPSGTPEFKQATIDVAERIKESVTLKAQDAYNSFINRTDDEFVASLAEKNGVSVEQYNKDIDFTAKKYGVSRDFVINKLKGSL